MKYEALLLVSFGGPEGPEDVMPFLDNVLRGRNVPLERKREVAHHYELFGGVSPINDLNRQLIRSLEAEFAAHNMGLPVYWGNRNWHPFLDDTLRAMAEKGVRRALGFFTSAYSSYSGCRQYREDLARAREALGPDAPQVDKIRVYYNHPDFIRANSDHVREALEQVPEKRRDAALLLFTAHSIPSAMAQTCAYESQLREACELVAGDVGRQAWRLVYQSRSGPPSQPWLEPDVCDVLERLPAAGVKDVVLAPIGFVSDHIEVLYDLDTEARERCDEVGLRMVRAATAGTHPRFVSMVRDLVQERQSDRPERHALGPHGPWHDVCPEDCCPAPRRP